MSSYISTHIIDAEGRLLQQYKNKPNLSALLDSLVGPIQSLEDAARDLSINRGVNSAVGVQLDRLGDIVGLTRNHLSDDVYRLRIKVRIIQNLSQGEPDRLLQVFQFLVGATNVHYEEHYPAGSALVANAPIPAGQETFFYENIQNIAPAGARVDYIGTVPADVPFIFAGGQAPGGGFGDLNNSLVGGGFGSMAIPTGLQFKFAGQNPDNLGFGDLRDPYMGGRLVGQ